VKINIKKLHPDVITPSRVDSGSAGYDLYAYLPLGSLTILPGQTALVSLGFMTQFGPQYEIQVRSRSGLSLKHGIIVLNAPGTIDSSYRGEWKVILHNVSNVPHEIKHGDRIAQAVVCKVPWSVWSETQTLEETSRGAGGFGSSGR
jgi:dUTP pyrophosphatase